MRELVRYLPPLMRNQFWTAFMETVQEEISSIQTSCIDPIKSTLSISESSEEELIEIASSVYQLDEFMLKNMIEFLEDLEVRSGNTTNPREVALAKVRQEIQKIPYNMNQRGSKNYYKSFLNFCDFDYPGAIFFTMTDSDSRIGCLYTSINLEENWTPTTVPVVTPPVSLETIMANDNYLQTRLDQLVETTTPTGEEILRPGQLDDPTHYQRLDDIQVSSTLSFRKVLALGFLIDNRTSGFFSSNDNIQPTFPESLGKFYQAFMDLNKRATDVIMMGPMLSLNLSKTIDDSSSQYDSYLANGRMTVEFRRDLPTLMSNDNNNLLEMWYVDGDPYADPETGVETIPDPFFVEPIKARNYHFEDVTEGGSGRITDRVLSLFACCPGEEIRHQEKVTITSSTYSFDIPKEDWTNYFSLKVEKQNSMNSLWLFYKDVYGNLILKVNNTEVAGSSDKEPDLVASVTEGDDKITITLSGVDGASVPRDSYTIAYVSQKFHTKVKMIRLMLVNSDYPSELFRIYFRHPNSGVELTRGISLMSYLQLHWDDV